MTIGRIYILLNAGLMSLYILITNIYYPLEENTGLTIVTYACLFSIAFIFMIIIIMTAIDGGEFYDEYGNCFAYGTVLIVLCMVAVLDSGGMVFALGILLILTLINHLIVLHNKKRWDY